ncbi:MAG TPA: DNA polymerase III subunit [Polyangiaceae bacterium]|nr:DNA polymerase III subunit [Polyangiaceae bacterium]
MPGLLSTLRAQATAVDTLRRALATDRVHHAYLFDGPNGVGKELAAFGLAQALVCERREPGNPSACGECRACVRAVPRPGEARPVHPDVVVLERGLYEPATIGRRTPETQDLSIDQVRTLVLARAAFPPHEGRAKVFIVRRAEEMNQAAANALLKTLEEPGPRTHFVLLSAVGDSLLPTIRSRTQRVRFGALPDDVVEGLLTERGVEGAAAIARLAGGSMAVALDLGDPEATARREEFVGRALAAVEARDLEGGLALAEEAKKVGKEASMLHLEALAAAFATRAREAASNAGRAADVATLRHGLALAAVEQIDANASTQLAMEAMFIRLRAV